MARYGILTGVLQCMQALRLSAAVCFRALHELETGCSAHSSVQKAARELADACCRRLGAAFERETVSGDKELQAALLRYLGPLHQMLNNRQRRQLFVRLPLAVVRVGAVQVTAAGPALFVREQHKRRCRWLHAA